MSKLESDDLEDASGSQPSAMSKLRRVLSLGQRPIIVTPWRLVKIGRKTIKRMHRRLVKICRMTIKRMRRRLVKTIKRMRRRLVKIRLKIRRKTIKRMRRMVVLRRLTRGEWRTTILINVELLIHLPQLLRLIETSSDYVVMGKLDDAIRQVDQMCELAPATVRKALLPPTGIKRSHVKHLPRLILLCSAKAPNLTALIDDTIRPRDAEGIRPPARAVVHTIVSRLVELVADSKREDAMVAALRTSVSRLVELAAGSPGWNATEKILIFARCDASDLKQCIETAVSLVGDINIIVGDQATSRTLSDLGISHFGLADQRLVPKGDDIAYSEEASRISNILAGRLSPSYDPCRLFLANSLRSRYRQLRRFLYVLDAAWRDKQAVLLINTPSYLEEIRSLAREGLFSIACYNVRYSAEGRFFKVIRGSKRMHLGSPAVNKSYDAGPHKAIHTRSSDAQAVDLAIVYGANQLLNYWQGFQPVLAAARGRKVLLVTRDTEVADYARSMGIEKVAIVGPEPSELADHDEARNLLATLKQLDGASNIAGMDVSEMSAAIARAVMHTHVKDILFVRKMAARFSERRRVCDLLDMHRPRQLLIFPVGASISLAAAVLSRELGIPSYSFVSVTVAGHARSISSWDVDDILVYGSQAVDAFSRMGYAESRLFVAGNPTYDRLIISSRAAKPRAGTTTILIATSRIDLHEDDWIDEVVDWVEGKINVEIVIRPHPSYGPSDYRCSKRLGSLPVRFSTNKGAGEDVLEATAVITDYSTVGAEALLADRPLLVVNLTGQEYPSNQYDEMGLALRTSSITQIRGCLEQLIGAPPPSQSNPTAYVEFTTAYNGPNDGYAAKRIVEHIVGLRCDVAPKPPEIMHPQSPPISPSG